MLITMMTQPPARRGWGCVEFRAFFVIMRGVVCPYVRLSCSQVRFVHTDVTESVRDKISEFNAAQGKGVGSFFMVAYWSRADMSMRMKTSEGHENDSSLRCSHVAALPPVFLRRFLRCCLR